MAETSQNNQSKDIDIYNIIITIIDVVIMLIKFHITLVTEIVKFFLPREEVSVSGDVVLITGTGHGIGKETALKYGALGAKVICWDINEQNNLETVKQIKAAGGQAHAYVCNVTNRNDSNELASRVKREHGFVKIIINNAGIMPCHPILQHTETEIRNLYEINVLAHFWIIQAFLPDMIERNEGSIVSISSCAGLFGISNLVPYCGTKFAVRGYMQALDEELHHNNPQNRINITTIYPYMVDTGLCKKPRYRFPNLMRLVKPTEAANAIITAQRTGVKNVSVPSHFLILDKLFHLLPLKAVRVINDFLDAGVDSDL